jgi:ATP/maltotriose-dependent transcriptional regulator MalT
VNVARIEAPLRARASEVLHEIAKRPPTGETYGERALLAEVAGQLTFESEPRERSLELARLALADGELLREESSDGMAWVAAMGALGWGDDFEGYEALQRQAIEDARRRGSVIGFATASYGYSFSHYYRGMLSDAIADAQQAIASERDGWRQFLPASRAQLAWALIDRGELDEAMAELHRARSDASWPRSSMQALVLEAQARVHLARAQPEPALRLALDAGHVFEQALIANPSIVPWRSRAAIAAFQLGERDRAQQLLEEELALAQRFGAPRPIGVALIATGIIQGKDGVEALEHAVQALAASPAQLEHARALVHLGAALRRRGHRKDARVTLRSGLQRCERFGAWLLAQRARTELTAAGGRIRRSAESGAASLTPAELRVATLAAEGLSNRDIAQALFVSLRTVETHLTHAYQKLDLDSRAKLATALETRRTQAEPADEATRRSASAQLSSG